MIKGLLPFLLLFSSLSHAVVNVRTRDEVILHFKEAGFSGTVGVFSPKGDFVVGLGPGVHADDHLLIGSVTKQFTAAAILKLVEQGKLKVTDPVSRYVPRLRSHEVTIHHLLTHTSGIRDAVGSYEFERFKITPFRSLGPLVALVTKMPIEFRAGSRFDYSNSNYFLLSHLVELRSGESWWSFVKRELVDPAGMTETNFVGSRTARLLPGHTFDRDYSLTPIAESAYFERGWANGAGGMESTVRDLGRWNEALHSGKILSAESLRQMTAAHTKSGKNEFVGYGLFSTQDEVTGESILFHPGGIPGYISQNAYYPKRKLSTIVLANYESSGEPEQLAKALASVESRGHASVPNYLDDPKVPRANNQKFVGRFRSVEGDSLDITFAQNQLYLSAGGSPEHRMILRGDSWFFDRSIGLDLHFSTDAVTVQARDTTYFRDDLR